MMRWLLVAVLLNGLVPSFGELLESVVHRIATDHYAHTAGDPHDVGKDTREHGCGPTAHHCGCCASQPMVARGRADLAVRHLAEHRMPSSCSKVVADGFLRDVFRPPIA